VPDFFVSDPGSGIDDDMPRGQACGAVFAFSGKTRKRIFASYGPAEHEFLGASLACVGDLNGDGTSDVIAEAGRYFRAVSGKNGAKLYDVARFTPPPAPPSKR